MTRDEVKRIVMIAQSAFPNWKVTDKQMLLDVWTEVFRDDDPVVIEAGLMNYIRTDTSGFAPSPGQLRTGIRKMIEPYDDTEEAIAELRTAISRSSYYSEEEFGKLRPAMQKAVGRPENLRMWARQEETDLENITLSHVRRAYRTIKEREKRDEAARPLDLETMRSHFYRLPSGIQNELADRIARPMLDDPDDWEEIK